MKKTIAFSLLFLCALVSCKTSENLVGDETSDEIYIPKRIESGKTNAFCYSADKSDTIESYIQYEYYTPQFSSNLMDSVYKDSVNLMISRDLSSETIGISNLIESSILSDYFFQSRLDSFVAMAQEEVDYLESVPWTLEQTFEITERASFIELNNAGWSYTGGAHGNYWSYFNLFDRKTGRVLKLNDFITDIQALNRFALPYFREQQEIPDGMTLEEYGFWFTGDNLELNDNFYIENGNIIFVFNPYAIAPYAAGSSELIIPIADLGELFSGNQ